MIDATEKPPPEERLHRLELIAGTILYLSAINFVLNLLIIIVAVIT